jgi:hypothetical protein
MGGRDRNGRGFLNYQEERKRGVNENCNGHHIHVIETWQVLSLTHQRSHSESSGFVTLS